MKSITISNRIQNKPCSNLHRVAAYTNGKSKGKALFALTDKSTHDRSLKLWLILTRYCRTRGDLSQIKLSYRLECNEAISHVSLLSHVSPVLNTSGVNCRDTLIISRSTISQCDGIGMIGPYIDMVANYTEICLYQLYWIKSYSIIEHGNPCPWPPLDCLESYIIM